MTEKESSFPREIGSRYRRPYMKDGYLGEGMAKDAFVALLWNKYPGDGIRRGLIRNSGVIIA